MLSNKKGVAMLIVIGLVFMLLILASAVLMVSTGHFGTSYHQIKRARAYYAAEAGMQHALWKCRTGGYGDLSSIVAGIPIPETITVDSKKPSGDLDYSFDVDIKIYALNDLPLGPTIPTPSGTYPIVIRVNY